MRVSRLGRNFAFFTPIDARTFATADGSARKPVWILGAAEGVWYNARHAEVPITSEDIERMFSNFSSGAYPPPPQKLPIDYEHLSVKADRKPGDGQAAGWIEDVDLRDNAELKRKELWLLVNWNDDGADAIAKNKYRGFSPLFHPNWITHGKKELGVTLLGGALTNYQTIPDCVVTCSLDPADKHRAFADVSELSYSDRERRVRDAIQARYPLQSRNGEVDYSTWVDVNFVWEDRVVFTRGGKTWRQEYTFEDDLTVAFPRDAEETLLTDSPIAASLIGVRFMKVKNAKGEDVEIPATSFAGFTLDALAQDIPAVKELLAKVPKAEDKVVSAKEFDTLSTQIQTLSTEVNALTKRATDAETALTTAKHRERDAMIDGLIAAGKVLPADREHLVELANEAPAVFEKRITALKAAAPLIKLGREIGRDGNPPPNDVVVQFDALVAEERKADSKIDTAEAIKRAAAKNPDLAIERNRALSPGVGPGGVLMTH
jgi:phage I-like protein